MVLTVNDNNVRKSKGENAYGKRDAGIVGCARHCVKTYLKLLCNRLHNTFLANY